MLTICFTHQYDVDALVGLPCPSCSHGSLMQNVVIRTNYRRDVLCTSPTCQFSLNFHSARPGVLESAFFWLDRNHNSLLTDLSLRVNLFPDRIYAFRLGTKLDLEWNCGTATLEQIQHAIQGLLLLS